MNIIPQDKLQLAKRIAAVTFIIFFTVSIVFSLVLYVNLKDTIPDISELRDIRHHQASQVLSADGKLLGSYFFQNRTQVDLEEISPLFIDALIAVEDIRYYDHNGIDRRAMMRVLIKSILLGQDAGGGSTLTQQLAKNLYPRNGRGWFNLTGDKIREMIIARRLEKLYSKDEILELYLNTVSFGEETFGIETASYRFFNRPSAELELHEAATLAGVLKAPGLYNPHRHPDRSKLRRDIVLRQMERYGKITPEEADHNISLPLETDYNRITENDGLAPHFREHLRVELQQILRNQPALDGKNYNLYSDGLIIRTTIDSQIQKAAEEAMRHRMKLLQASFEDQRGDTLLLPRNDPSIVRAWRRSNHYQQLTEEGYDEEKIETVLHTPRPMKLFTWDGEVEREISPHDSLRHYLSFLNAGFIAISPQSGEVRAWAGGIHHRYFQYDHVKSRRQAGSAFKPVVYASALETGMEPCNYQRNLLSSYESYDDWTPRNIREEYGGYYSLQAALAKSVNTIAVDLLLNTGIEKVIETANNLGLKSHIPREPSIALGTAEVSLIELVQAYAVFANGGYRTSPHYIEGVYDSQGRLLYNFRNSNLTNQREQVVKPETAAAMMSMLAKAVDEGTGHGLRSQFGLTGAIAGKTGTTQNYTDGWFIGMTPDLAFGTWVGGVSPRIRFTQGTGYASQTALPVAGQFLANMNNDTTLAPAQTEFYPYQQNTAFNTSCSDQRDDSTIDRFRDFVTGRSSDEPRSVSTEKESKNLIDRVRGLFSRN